MHCLSNACEIFRRNNESLKMISGKSPKPFGFLINSIVVLGIVVISVCVVGAG